MAPMDADVVVVGGGLGGAALALGLARRGISVICVDKAEFPRDKPCGEGLLPHGLDLLAQLGCGDVADACGGQPFRGILYHCHGVVARGDFEGGATGRGVRRRHLDALMRDRAADAGAVLRRGSAVDVDVDSEGATVTLDDGSTLRGCVVVGADGPRSIIRHRLGLDGGPPAAARYAIRRHVALADGATMPDRVEVHVGGDHELYVTPVEDGVVGVAALIEKPLMNSGVGSPDERLEALIAGCAPLAARLHRGTPLGRALACGPLRVKTKGVFRGRVVLIGDAAGYVDAITGEGMSLALKTASLAEAAVAAIVGSTDVGDADVDGAFRGYARARKRAFRDHAILTHGLVALARHPFFAKRAIARLAKDPALFTRLLAVNNGTRSVLSLGLVSGLKLAIGSSPGAAIAIADGAAMPSQH